jgi:hypothetical protein
MYDFHQKRGGDGYEVCGDVSEGERERDRDRVRENVNM